MIKYNPFQKAVPVWPAGRCCEMNVTSRFTAEIEGGKDTLVRMTGASVYRLFVNGKLAAHGPARGPKYFHRVDELIITDILKPGRNVLVFEAAGYNINNFYTMDQPSFFQAEVLRGTEIAAYTAPNGGMPCDVVTERVQRVQKYTFQRPFVEIWRLGEAYTASFDRMTDGKAQLEQVEDKVYLPRRVPFASLAPLPAEEIVSAGSFIVDEASNWWRGNAVNPITPALKGYPPEEVEVDLAGEYGAYVFSPVPQEPEVIPDKLVLSANRFATVKLHGNLTGFIGMHVLAKSHTVMTVAFDEMFEGDIRCPIGVNLIRWELEPGEYDLLSMDPYTLQYLKLVVAEGEAVISDIHLTEYSAPDEGIIEYHSDNKKLEKIWEAAVQTYRQNALDVYTDCPGRERAGWLCDSFWTARVEYALTGKTVVEKNFLENFLLPDSFEMLPKGMFPMCYPADHYDKIFIPNWAMWLIAELREYMDRSGDREMVDAFRPKLYDLMAYLDRFVNEDGLLENLESWVFVEWSRANDLVAGINFPTNMLYAYCLKAMSEMYGDEALAKRAEEMHETIRRLSFNGKFFVDQMLRDENGQKYLQGEVTEVCQYYAFYCGTATEQTHPDLWNTLLHDFGPHRKQDNKYPDVHFANCFIGNYLRLDTMSKKGYLNEVLENIEGYFYNMAVLSNTLWEMDSTKASLNHGFASHVAVWLLQEMQNRG